MDQRRKILGIVTDEEGMFDLLSKFLKREGYQVERVCHDAPANAECELLIFAPARGWNDFSEAWSSMKNRFTTLRDRKPTLIVIQSRDEKFYDDVDNVVMLQEGPLDLRQLSDCVKSHFAAAMADAA